MLIACPNCAKSYRVEASSIGARGRTVRCARCGSVWFAAPEAAGDEVVTAFRSELGSAAEAPSPAVADAPPVVADAPPTAPDAAPEPTAEPDGATNPGEEAADAPATAGAEEAGAEPAAVALANISIPVADAPPLAPGSDQGPPHDGEQPAVENGSEDIERAALRRMKPQPRRRAMPKGRMPLVIVALAIVCTALLTLRQDVVRQMPQLASFYASIGLPVNLRGLTFTNVMIGREMHDGAPVLVVEGTIVNVVSTPVDVPRLRFVLRNQAGAEVYAWTAVPTQTVLEPGAKLPFRSRLASPPDDGHDVQVRFFMRRDVVAGMR